MPTPSTSAVVRDVNNVPIPQGWNPATLAFEQINEQSNILFANPHTDPTSEFAFTTLYTSATLESSGVLKNAVGTLYRIFVHSTATTGGPFYLHLFNSTTVPVTGTTPVMRYIIPNGVTTQIDLHTFGKFFSTGISYAISSAFNTYSNTGVTAVFGVDAYMA